MRRGRHTTLACETAACETTMGAKGAMNLYAAISLGSVPVAVLLGNFVFYRAPRQRINQLYAVLCVWMSLWAFAEFQMRSVAVVDSARFWRQFTVIWPFAIASMAHFILCFSQSRLLARWRRIDVFLYAMAFAIAFIDYAYLEGACVRTPWGWSVKAPLGGRWLQLCVDMWAMAMAIMTLGIVVGYYLGLSDGRRRKQTKVVVIGTASVLVIGTVTELSFLLPALVGGSMPGMVQLGFMVASGCYAYAIWQYDLFISPGRIAEQIMAATPDAIVVIDRHSRVQLANAAAERMLGFATEELVGKPIDELISARSGGVSQLSLRKSSILDISMELRTRDGHTVPISLSTSPLHHRVEALRGTLLIGRDIHERLQAERTLAMAKEEAEAANRAKSKFLTNMSHELRTPLNGILGYAQVLLLDEDVSPQQRQGLEIIERSGEHLLMLIEDVLSFARIEAHKMELRPSRFALLPFITELVELFAMRAHQKGLAFMPRFEESLPATIVADQQRLRQVLLNLLGNAIKFTAAGRVVFRVRRSPGASAMALVFEVEDTGLGLRDEDIERVFQPFVQVSDDKHMVDGTGLGLPISQEIAQLMGSHIEVESTYGQGSLFRFAVPLSRYGADGCDFARAEQRGADGA